MSYWARAVGPFASTRVSRGRRGPGKLGQKLMTAFGSWGWQVRLLANFPNPLFEPRRFSSGRNCTCVLSNVARPFAVGCPPRLALPDRTSPVVALSVLCVHISIPKEAGDRGLQPRNSWWFGNSRDLPWHSLFFRSGFEPLPVRIDGAQGVGGRRGKGKRSPNCRVGNGQPGTST